MRSFAMAVMAVTLVGTSMAAAQTRGVTRQTWGKTTAGEAVDLYTLTNAKGASVQIATLGRHGRLDQGARQGRARSATSCWASTRSTGISARIRSSASWWAATATASATRRSRSTARRTRWRRTTASTPCTAGCKGFDKYVWKTREVPSPDGLALELTHVSPDGDEGFPGTLSVTVRYTWTDANGLRIDYTATTDKPTVAEPHEPRVLQPVGRRLADDPRPHAAPARRQVHAGRQGPDPHRRVARGGRDAV